MISLLCAAIVAAPSSTPVGTDWHKTHDSAMELAQKVDQHLNALSDASLSYYFQYLGQYGKGYINGKGYIKSPTVFHLEFPHLGNEEDDGMLKGIWVANGAKLFTRIEWPEHPSPITSQALPGKRLPGQATADRWFTDGFQDIFAAVGGNSKPVEDLVKSASSPSSPYTVTASERTYVIQKHGLTYYRITVRTKPQIEKKEGVKFYEIVVGAHYYLPISISNEYKPKIGKYKGKIFLITLNQTKWSTKVKSFDPKLFTSSSMDPVENK